MFMVQGIINNEKKYIYIQIPYQNRIIQQLNEVLISHLEPLEI